MVTNLGLQRIDDEAGEWVRYSPRGVLGGQREVCAAIHGGTAKARPREDGGLLVTVTIPAADIPALRAGIPATDRPTAPRPGAGRPDQPGDSSLIGRRLNSPSDDPMARLLTGPRQETTRRSD